MRRVVIIAILVLAVVSGASAVEFTSLKWMDSGFSPEIGIGAAYYSDTYDDSLLAYYVQTPVVSWKYATVGFGGTFPVEEFGRSRPHFSLDVGFLMFKNYRLQLGTYVMVSPYHAWGGHAGVAIRF